MQNFDKKHDYEISFYKHILKIETIFCQFQKNSIPNSYKQCLHTSQKREAMSITNNICKLIFRCTRSKTVLPNSIYR